MKILITSNKHPYYDRVGEIVGRDGDKWVVRLQDGDEEITVSIAEKDFKPTRD